MSIGKHILRGVVCGLLAGLLAGLFALILAEPTIDRAAEFEYQRVAAAASATGTLLPPTVFSRPTQHFGLIVATLVVGMAVGGLFGIALFVFSGRRTERSMWERALGLGAASFVGFYFIPFLRYPANPPGVGDPSTITLRSSAHLLATLLGLGAIWGAWRLAIWLRQQGVSLPVRQTGVALAFLTFIGTGYALLPSDTDPVRVPATLLWNFRLLSVATQVILWVVLASSFGLWSEWTARQTSARARTA